MNTDLLTIMAGKKCEENNSQLIKAVPWRDGIITVELTSAPVLYPWSVCYKTSSHIQVLDKSAHQATAERLMDAFLHGTIQPPTN